MTDKKSFLDSPEWAELQQTQLEWEKQFEKEAEDAWNSLDYEHRLRVFYAVCKRIYKGDIVNKGSYRYVLYDVFGFDPDAYAIGMMAGYMAIHNSIVDIDEFEDLKKKYKELLAITQDDLK